MDDFRTCQIPGVGGVCVIRLDSHIVTSVSHTYFLLAEYQKTIEGASG